MSRLSIAFFIVAMLAAVPAGANGQGTDDLEHSLSVSPGQITPTPEMWFYEQSQRRWEDPKAAVRRKAEHMASQRRNRINAMRWFGFSNQRPQCFSEPYHGFYSPTWVSNNSHYPFQWNGVGRPWVFVGPHGIGLAGY